MKNFAVVLIGALALGGAAQAVEYDAFDSFNGVNGNGGFTYVKISGQQGVPPTLLTAPAHCTVTSDVCLQDPNGALPGAYKSLTELNELTYHVPDDRLLLHPGANSALGIFFTAPETGDYTYDVVFDVLDRSPTGVFITGGSNASGAFVPDPLGGLNGLNKTIGRHATISLDKGEFIAFFLNNGGNYANDSTGFQLTLHREDVGAVPEPGAWVLMILGFGLAGAAARSRRAMA